MGNNLFDLQLLEGNQALPPNTDIIDFGIGKIAVTLQSHSSINILEFIEALKKAALTVPLSRLTESINKFNRF